MENNLVNSSYIQFKCLDYFVEYDGSEHNEQLDKTFINTMSVIKSRDTLPPSPAVIPLEPMIQYLSKLKLPDVEFDYKSEIDFTPWCDLGLELTKRYGFLNYKKHHNLHSHIIEANEYPLMGDEDRLNNQTMFNKLSSPKSYDGEHVFEWKHFLQTFNFIKESLVNSDFYNDDIETKIYETQNFNHYMIDVFPEFNIETSEIELKCNTLPSAVFLFMINNKKRLKICEECSSLFGGKKSNAQFCSNNCAKKNQRNRSS